MDILSIIYRKSSYNSLQKFIDHGKKIFKKGFKLEIYYKTNLKDVDDLKLEDKVLINIGELNVTEVKEIIYEKNKDTNNRILILDTCVNYNFSEYKNQKAIFILLESKRSNFKGIYIPYLLFYDFSSKSLDEEEFIGQHQKSNIYFKEDSVNKVDENFNKDFSKKGTLECFVSNFLVRDKLNYHLYNLEYDKGRYEVDICNYIDNGKIIEKENDYLFLLTMIKHKKLIDIPEEEPFLNYILCTPESTKLFIINEMMCQNPRNIKKWIDEKDISILDKYYDDIVEELKVGLKLDDNYEDRNILYYKNKNYLLKRNGWYKEENGIIENVMSISVKKKYNFLGNVVVFLNYFIVLVKVTDKCYKFAYLF